MPDFLDALAEHAPLLAANDGLGEDATYQNRVHLTFHNDESISEENKQAEQTEKGTN